MNNNMVPLVQAVLLPEKGQIMIQVMPGVTDPVRCLMQVAAACAKAAEGQLETEREKPKADTAILRAMPGMRVPRID